MWWVLYGLVAGLLFLPLLTRYLREEQPAGASAAYDAGQLGRRLLFSLAWGIILPLLLIVALVRRIKKGL